ncbi:hypothetical protein RUND412_010601 [Rhizina undulata]
MSEQLSTPQKLLRESLRARLTSSIDREHEKEHEMDVRKDVMSTEKEDSALQKRLMPPPPNPHSGGELLIPATPPPDEEMIDWTRLAEESFDGKRYRRRGLRFIQDEARREERRRMGRESYARRRNSGKTRFETTGNTTEGESMDIEMMLPEGINDRDDGSVQIKEEKAKEASIPIDAIPASQPRGDLPNLRKPTTTIQEPTDRPASALSTASESSLNADTNPLRRVSTKRHHRSPSTEKIISPNPPKKKRLSFSSGSTASNKSWKSRFKEGSMNDRISKVPPPEVIGVPTPTSSPPSIKSPAASTAPESTGGFFASVFSFNPFRFVTTIRESFEKQKREYEKRERERKILKERKKRSREVYAAVKRGGGFEPTVIMESPGGAYDTAEARRRRSRWDEGESKEGIKKEDDDMEDELQSEKMSLDMPGHSQLNSPQSENPLSSPMRSQSENPMSSPLRSQSESEMDEGLSQRDPLSELESPEQPRSKSLDARTSSLFDLISVSSKPTSTSSSTTGFKKDLLKQRSKSLISSFRGDKEEKDRARAEAASKREARRQERLERKVKELENQLSKVKGELESFVGNSSVEGSFVGSSLGEKSRGKDTKGKEKAETATSTRSLASEEGVEIRSVSSHSNGSWDKLLLPAEDIEPSSSSAPQSQNSKLKPPANSKSKSKPKPKHHESPEPEPEPEQEEEQEEEQEQEQKQQEETEENDPSMDEGFSMIPLSPVIHPHHNPTTTSSSSTAALRAIPESSPPPNVAAPVYSKDKGAKPTLGRWGSSSSSLRRR